MYANKRNINQSINQSINSKSRVTRLLLKRSKRNYRLHGHTFLYKHSTKSNTVWCKNKYKGHRPNARDNNSIQNRKKSTNRSLERGTKTKEFKNTKQVIEIKPGWYNFVLERPLKGRENKNIQYIIEVEGSYGIASIKPLTIEDINNIDLKEWNFKPFKEWEEIWKQNKKVK